MLIARRVVLAAVVCLFLVSLASAFAAPGVVTVDFAAKSGKTDSATLDARNVKVLGEQVGVQVKSSLITPQPVTIKFVGLRQPAYDVYVNGAFIGEKTASSLAEGLEQTIPGRVTNADAMHMLAIIDAQLPEVYAKIKARKGAEPWRAAYTLGQAKDWARTGVRDDEIYRSILVIAVPAGSRMESMGFIRMREASEVTNSAQNIRDLMHSARSNMYNVLKDAGLRNEVVAALTPVRFIASCFAKNGKPCITASVTNDCDMPITGKMTLTLPKGWKTVGAKLDIGKLQAGRTHTTTFSLAPTAKNAVLPKSVPMTTVVDIANEYVGARLWLYATPACPKP